MIRFIAHLADVHIRKNPTRNDEYEKVFNNIIQSISEKKPDRIVIVGDLVNDYLDLQGEQLILAANFLNNLAEIAPVRIIRGNHDYKRKDLKRVDSIQAIIKTIKNPNIIYYNKTDVYYDENIAWFVWHHGEKNNPWKTKEGKIYEKLRINGDYVAIDLFHDPINGCKSTTGFELQSKIYHKLSDLNGDFVMLGDIHAQQYLDDNKTKAYSGSVIAQDFSEGDDQFHGYLLWNITERKAKEIPIYNEYSYKNIKITPYTDFDDLDYDISNPTPHMKIRLIWMTLPQTRTKENERKIIEYLKNKYSNITISHKNEFIENNKIEINDSVTLQNISTQTVQHEIFKEYFKKIGADEKFINDIISLDDEITKDIVSDGIENIEWNVIKFGATNFMSYKNFDIDWRDMDGIFQIRGDNAGGKTTIFKTLTYILFGKTLETESRIKFGDQRFVNNRNDAKYCEGYLVIEANGEYYGIKKKTEIQRNKSGEIVGSPTTVNYYLLNNPDDVMDDDNLIDKLSENNRIATQKKIETIIGTYDNFMRVVMTTSDTLNRILSNDMAIFIDSLLFDSGLDIFDKKLESVKKYEKGVNDANRISCNIELTTLQNSKLLEEINNLESEIINYENNKIPQLQDRIKIGQNYVEDLIKKLYKLDPEIYNLNVNDIKTTILSHNSEIDALLKRKNILENNINSLKNTYDVEKLNQLNEKRESHKTEQYGRELKIKSIEREISDENHKIEIINGEIFRLKERINKLNNEIIVLKNSKICTQCGQEIKKEHIDHINNLVNEKENEIITINNDINHKESVDKKNHEEIIKGKKNEILEIKNIILQSNLDMDDVLKQIGEITNDKNDVEKRKEFQIELEQIPLKIQTEELRIRLLQQKIDNYDNSLKQIEENKIIEKNISLAKQKLLILKNEENEYKEDVFIRKTSIGEKRNKIMINEKLMADFREQEYRDLIINSYKKCVHRDGIPRQILSTYIIPKINSNINTLLKTSPFNVWLDQDDLRLKLAYHNRPTAIIDCISASGKERTFSSVVLKFALNQINVKSKPSMFLLDEVMGKLNEESSSEFIEMLQTIKNYMKKILIIEHRINLDADYVIDVALDENDISYLVIQ